MKTNAPLICCLGIKSNYQREEALEGAAFVIPYELGYLLPTKSIIALLGYKNYSSLSRTLTPQSFIHKKDFIAALRAGMPLGTALTIKDHHAAGAPFLVECFLDMPQQSRWIWSSSFGIRKAISVRKREWFDKVFHPEMKRCVKRVWEEMGWTDEKGNLKAPLRNLSLAEIFGAVRPLDGGGMELARSRHVFDEDGLRPVPHPLSFSSTAIPLATFTCSLLEERKVLAKVPSETSSKESEASPPKEPEVAPSKEPEAVPPEKPEAAPYVYDSNKFVEMFIKNLEAPISDIFWEMHESIPRKSDEDRRLEILSFFPKDVLESFGLIKGLARQMSDLQVHVRALQENNVILRTELQATRDRWLLALHAVTGDLSRIQTIEKDLALLSGEARLLITPPPLSSDKPKRASVRSLLNRLVHSTAAATGEKIPLLWTELYNRAEPALGVRLRSKAMKKTGLANPLDIAGEMGLMEDLYAIASDLFRKRLEVASMIKKSPSRSTGESSGEADGTMLLPFLAPSGKGSK